MTTVKCATDTRSDLSAEALAEVEAELVSARQKTLISLALLSPPRSALAERGGVSVAPYLVAAEGCTTNSSKKRLVYAAKISRLPLARAR